MMAVFNPLFSLNILGTRLGWQTVAIARWKREAPTKPSS
jgi:hypothetical protein